MSHLLLTEADSRSLVHSLLLYLLPSFVLESSWDC